MDGVAITLKDIVFLLGLGITIGAPIIKLNVTIAKLMAKLELLSGDLSELSSRNAGTHKRLFDSLDSQSGILADHETRITVLEHDYFK